MIDVLTIGSATLDIFLKSSQFRLVSQDGKLALCEAFNEKIDVEEAVISSGGGATNTAVGFSRLGLRAMCIAEVGKDFAGSVVEQDLREEGVDTSLLIREEGEHTAISSLLISNDGARTALVHRGASRMLTVGDIPWDRLETKWVHLSSIGNIEVISRVFSFCKEKNIRLGWNPGNWEIEHIKAGKLVPDWSTVDILFVNREEMTVLSGNDLSSEEAWKASWCFKGPKVSIVTDGSNGGRYCKDGKCSWFEALRVEAVQETGAGDAFACGVVAGVLMGKPLESAVELGKKESASVIQRMGAKTGLLRSA